MTETNENHCEAFKQGYQKGRVDGFELAQKEVMFVVEDCDKEAYEDSLINEIFTLTQKLNQSRAYS
jgi:flagellar biosynthesis/type III secretory pathway protein FliH